MQVNSEFLITIITVVKDDLKGFLLTAESILPHLDSSIEWLIVDGSAGQEISNWCSQNSHMKNISYDWQHPMGIYHAMNQGVALARGEWLWFINASDILIGENSLSRIKTILNESIEWKILATHVVYLTPKGKYYALVSPSILPIYDYKIARFHHQGVLTSRSVFDKIGVFDTRLKYASDGKFLDAAVASFQYSFSSVISCGFSMGGSSMQNFAQTISETSTYRPMAKPRPMRFFYLKNMIRKMLITFEDSIILGRYLRIRHKRIMKEVSNIDVEFIPAKSLKRT
jgi:glycosyltransferase involved in cell wall biosynthesis